LSSEVPLSSTSNSRRGSRLINTKYRSHSITSASQRAPSSSISVANPAPHLFFALASDSPAKVSKLLSSGQADANDTAGPNDLPALVFSLTNDQLRNKTEIVKTLLAHGADPSVVQHLVPSAGPESGQFADSAFVGGGEDDQTEVGEADESPLASKLRETMNPAIRYVALLICTRLYTGMVMGMFTRLSTDTI
jgi:hypothetical protein